MKNIYLTLVALPTRRLNQSICKTTALETLKIKDEHPKSLSNAHVYIILQTNWLFNLRWTIENWKQVEEPFIMFSFVHNVKDSGTLS